jgi:hypothetical protein
MEKPKWHWIWVWAIKAGIAFILELAMIFLGDLRLPCASIPIDVPCGLIVGVLAVLLFFLLLGIVQLCWFSISKIIYHLKHLTRKETIGDFSPTIFQDKNILYLKITCPKKVLFCANVTYSLEYLKPELSRIEKTKPKTKSELYSNLLKNVIDPGTIKISNWFDFPFTKVRRNNIAKIPVFEIDSKEEIFYLFRKSGKPRTFWNNEMFPQLDEISFGHGEYDFKMKISAKPFLGKKIIQHFSFPLKF